VGIGFAAAGSWRVDDKLVADLDSVPVESLAPDVDGDQRRIGVVLRFTPGHQETGLKRGDIGLADIGGAGDELLAADPGAGGIEQLKLVREVVGTKKMGPDGREPAAGHGEQA
jgi:hypothetical protein